MNVRRFLAEAAVLVALAVACALVSNALAGKERRLELPGDYPNATKVLNAAERAALPAFDAAGPATSEASKETAAPAPAVAPAVPSRRPSETGRPAPAGARDAAPSAPAGPPPAAGAADAIARPAPAGLQAAAEALRRFPPHGQPFVEIPGDAAAWLHARGVPFLDARRSKDFAESHVAGARSFPVWEPEVVKEKVEAFLAEGHDHSAPLVAYCTGGDCEDSHMLAQTLFGAGFENVLVYRDGFPDWLARGGALAAGRGR